MAVYKNKYKTMHMIQVDKHSFQNEKEILDIWKQNAMYLQRTFIYKWIIGTVSLSQWLLLGLQGPLFILFIDQIPYAFIFAQLYCAGLGEGCFDLEYVDIRNTNSVVLITQLYVFSS